MRDRYQNHCFPGDQYNDVTMWTLRSILNGVLDFVSGHGETSPSQAQERQREVRRLPTLPEMSKTTTKVANAETQAEVYMICLQGVEKVRL